LPHQLMAAAIRQTQVADKQVKAMLAGQLQTRGYSARTVRPRLYAAGRATQWAFCRSCTFGIISSGSARRF
jgi:hypothetical protein